MVRIRLASEYGRQVLPVVVCVAHVVHDHLAKVGLLRELIGAALCCLLLGRLTSCFFITIFGVFQCFLEGSVQALLVFTNELTEEFIVAHLLRIHPHDISVIVLHDMLANHR